MIGIVDYGLGNIQAFVDIYKRLNITAAVVRTAQELQSVDRIILPGVGAFDGAMKRLNDSGMRETLDELVLHGQRPVLGVCVGMQMMADGSDEGQMPGLGWIPGRVMRFNEQRFAGQKTRLPHMGWNDVKPSREHPLFSEMQDQRFYFLHSYHFEPNSAEHILSTTDYGGHFVSAIASGRILGTQFHPEKSHHWGTQLLMRFAES